MTRAHEKLLVAALAGIIIASAAAFAVQPVLAGSVGVKPAPSLIVPSHDVLTLQLSPKG